MQIGLGIGTTFRQKGVPSLTEQIRSLLFGSGQQGAWYDPSDMSTLFQDSAGTVPVTAVEQPVGRILDKSGRGNHASQATTTQRPVLSARVNLLTKTAFSGAAVGVPGTAPTGWSSNFNTASITGVSSLGIDYAIQLTASAQRLFFAQSFSAASSTTYSLSCLVVENSGIPIGQLLGFTGMPTGATLQCFINGVSVSDSAVPLAGSRAELRLVNGATAGTPAACMGIGCSTNATGVVSVAKPDVRVTNDGVGLPPYQRVVDPNTYDTVGFPLYLRFDGVDDWMQTAPIDFRGVTAMLIMAAVRKLSDASRGIIVELGPKGYAQPGSINIEQAFFSPDWSSSYSGATGNANVTEPGLPAPVSAVVGSYADQGVPSIQLRYQGKARASSTAAVGGGGFMNAPLYIGRRGSGVSPANMRLYGLLIRAGQASDNQVAAVESYLNQKARVY